MKYLLMIIVLACGLDTCREMYLSWTCEGKYSWEQSKCYSKVEVEKILKERGYLFD